MIYAQHFSQEEFREWAEDMSPRLTPVTHHGGRHHGRQQPHNR